MAEPIVFYFEFASPYAYLAAQRIDEAAARRGRGVDWRAISLAHVLKARGVSRDAMPREKLDYILRDAFRVAEMAGVAIRMPRSFPTDSKAARQAFWRLKARDPALAVRFARAAYDRYWGRGEDIATAEQLAEAAAPLGVARGTPPRTPPPRPPPGRHRRHEPGGGPGGLRRPELHRRRRAVLGPGPHRHARMAPRRGPAGIAPARAALLCSPAMKP
jgi:2-hydroxychromene-2-carboxylate isomerase